MKEELKNNIIELNKKLILFNSYSSLFRRAWGGFLDSLIIGIISFPIHFCLKFLFPNQELIINYILLLFVWAYDIYHMSSEKQATLGGYFSGVRFATIDGMPITKARAFARTFTQSLLSVTITLVCINIFQEDNYFKIIIIHILIFTMPYFFTKQKQLLTDLLIDTIALKDDLTGNIKEKIKILD